jgi:hypothetical protein
MDRGRIITQSRFCMESNFYMEIFGQKESFECERLKATIMGMYGSCLE